MKFPSMICFILLARSDNVAADNGTTPDAAANAGTANAVADGVGADGLVSDNILDFCHGDYFIGFVQRERVLSSSGRNSRECPTQPNGMGSIHPAFWLEDDGTCVFCAWSSL